MRIFLSFLFLLIFSSLSFSKDFSDTVVDVSKSVVTIHTRIRLINKEPTAVDMVVATALAKNNHAALGPSFKIGGTTGSGFFISKNLIVTNFHVINGAIEMKIVLFDETEINGEIIGGDENTDIAIIKVDNNRIEPLTWGDSDKVKLGQGVFAIGSPLALDHTVTKGIISSVREMGISPLGQFIQVDAPINHGNSGGPLFNIEGKVIGMNSIIISPTNASIGLGFAIPSNDIKYVINELLTTGSFKGRAIGVQISSVDESIKILLNVKDTNGVLVTDVVDGSSSFGILKKNDIILKVGNTHINTIYNLIRNVYLHKVGDKIELTIIRDGKEEIKKIIVGTR